MKVRFPRFDDRSIWLQVTVTVVIGLLATLALIFAPDSIQVQSEKGTLDLSDIRISETPVKLTGEWAFYWHELLEPDDIHTREAEKHDQERWIDLPRSWLGYALDDQKLGSTGYATYRLNIRLADEESHERLALRMPSIFQSYRLWINGELLAAIGEVGESGESVTPRLATKLVFFQPESDTVELVMQVANFHHHRGGITKFIELGGSDRMAFRTNLKIACEMFITASLMMIGLYHLLLFFLRRKDKAPLYFGLLTFSLSIRSLLVGEIILTMIWPACPWELQFKIEYLILSSCGYLTTRYARCIFPLIVPRWFLRSSEAATGLLCALVILTPALIYTKALPIIGVVVVTHMVYLMAGLVLAFRSRLEGARIFLWVSVITLVTVINDFLYYSELSPVGNTSPLGLLVFTIAQMTLISARFTRTAANEERIARELQEANAMLTGMNTNLEKLVQERTQALSVAHEDLRTSYDKLLQSEQGRKKLLAYITHDLRMPLSSMLGYVEAVRDMVKPERNEQYLRYIRDNTIRIHRMIEELSFLSHLETGQISYRMEKVRVARFLRDFHGQYELVVRDAGLDFVLDCGEEAPGGHAPVVEMDVQRLEQALFNLVSNAMKFTASGGSIRLTLRIEEVRGTRYAVVGVEDTGIGIPPDQLERIFERNYRYDRPGSENGPTGNGLGLAICREIVIASGGTIRAESDGVMGASFMISLPCVQAV